MQFLPILSIFLFLIIKYAGKEIWQKLVYQSPLRKKLIPLQEREEVQDYLKNITYYTNLSPAGKEKFVDRLFVFMLNKEFIGRTIDVTEEMRVQISASAIQLTFGLGYYKLESLETIVIHPDIFQLSQRSPEYKGATSGHYMHLSWKSFQEGYQISDDNLNLGLHEMTHALKLTLYLGNRFDVVFAGRMEYWEELLREKYELLRTKPNFLRSYSKTNTEEFFAVCVEAFFESPEKFRQELPEIYQALVFLLNQDIRNKMRDYEIAEGYFTGNSYNIPQPTDVKTSYKYSNSHWSVNLMLFGCCCFLPTIVASYARFMAPVQIYFLMAAFLGTIGLLQKRYFFERKIFSGTYFFLYAYFGFGVSAVTILLWLNFFIPLSKTYEAKFSVKYSNGYRIFTDTAKQRDYSLEHELFNNAHLFDVNNAGAGHYLVFKYHYGILGIKKVDNYYFTDNE